MSDEPRPPIDPDRTLGPLLGFEILTSGAEAATGRFEVTDRVRQPMGIVHGGAYAAMAEGLASLATFDAVYPEGKMAVGLSNNTSFLRPVSAGVVHASARAIHRGRTTWVWEVEFTDDAGRACAATRVTMAVRDLPEGPSRSAGTGS